MDPEAVDLVHGRLHEAGDHAIALQHEHRGPVARVGGGFAIVADPLLDQGKRGGGAERAQERAAGDLDHAGDVGFGGGADGLRHGGRGRRQEVRAARRQATAQWSARGAGWRSRLRSRSEKSRRCSSSATRWFTCSSASCRRVMSSSRRACWRIQALLAVPEDDADPDRPDDEAVHQCPREGADHGSILDDEVGAAWVRFELTEPFPVRRFSRPLP